jgi:hypothetical protein
MTGAKLTSEALLETFQRELEATRDVQKAVLAVANAVRAHEVPEDEYPQALKQTKPISQSRKYTRVVKQTQKPFTTEQRKCGEEIIAEVALETGTTPQAMLTKTIAWRRYARSRWLAAYLMRRRGTYWKHAAEQLGCSAAAVYLGMEAALKDDPEFSRQADAVWQRLVLRWDAETTESKEAA